MKNRWSPPRLAAALVVGLALLAGLPLRAENVSGSVALNATYTQKDENKTVLRLTTSYSFSLSGVYDVRQVKSEVKAGGMFENMSTEDAKYEYEAKVRRGSKLKASIACTGISGSEVMGEGFTVAIQTGSPIDAVNDFKRTGQGTPSASTTIDVPKDSRNTKMTILFQGGGATGGYMTVDKPWPPSLEVRVHLTVVDDEAAVAPGADDGQEAEDEDVGAHYEEDNEAWNFDGVWPFAIPASVVIGLLGYTLTNRKDKNGKDEEQQEKPDRASMHVYKEFGDTLLAGEQPKQVFARIVRTSPKGQEYHDPMLTQMIQITSGDNYLQVTDGGIAGDWRMAWVAAPDAAQVPQEAIVTFRVANDTGSYTNRLHFQVEAGKVLFGQDNLTLPAHYDKEVRLPFVVTGIEQGTPVIASIVEPGGQPTAFYSVRAEWNAKKELYEAVISDQRLDPKIDNGTPGNYIPFTLKVEAKHPSGRVIEGRIALVRYYMGLVFKVGNVNCYLTEYDQSKHHKPLVWAKRTENGTEKMYVPAETIGRLQLYEYDEERHQVLVIDPLPMKDSFSVKAVDASEQEAVDGIGLRCDIIDNRDPKGTKCLLRCVRGALDPPSRIDVVFTFAVKYQDKEYKCETQALLCSQPRRTFDSDADWMAARKEDERVMQQLQHLRELIVRWGVAGRLMPLIKFMDNLEAGFDPDYGFDRSQIHFVGAMFNHMVSERYEYTFDENRPLGLSDELLIAGQALIDAANTLNEKIAIPMLIARIAVGFFTYGASEAQGWFRLYDAMSIGLAEINLTQIYINHGTDGLTKSLIVMAKDTVKFQILMTGIQIGLHLGFSGVRAKLNPQVSTPVRPQQIQPRTPPKASPKQYPGARKGRITKEAIKKSRLRQEKAARDVRSPQTKAKVKAGKPKRDLTEAIKYNEAKANRDIQDLHAIIEMCEQNPTPENLARMRKLVLDVQSNKMAMYKLKNLGPEYKDVRAAFNREMMRIYDEVDNAVIREIAYREGVPPEMIHRGNVSSSKAKALWEGDTLTFDRDTHYYMTDAKGKKVFFEQKYTERVYNRKFFEKAKGYKAKDQAAADRFGKKMDQTIIEDAVNHPESFGPDDVGLLMDKNRHHESLSDPNKVADAIIYKSEERFIEAEAKLAKADLMADPQERVKLQSEAINDLLEGNRMTAKDANNFVIPMDEARADFNGGLLVSDRLQRGIEHCQLVDQANPIDINELQVRVESEGYASFSELAHDLGETMRRVGSPKLS